MKTILVAASLAVCAAGCSTAAPPETFAAPPQPSAPPAPEVLERSATVVSATNFGDGWKYVLAHDDDTPTVTAFVDVRRADGETFVARVSEAGRRVTKRFADADAPQRHIAELAPLPEGRPLPVLAIGERLTYVPVGALSVLYRPEPRRGASDVPPLGR